MTLRDVARDIAFAKNLFVGNVDNATIDAHRCTAVNQL